MNAVAKRLGMHKTNYANSHGLVNPDNRSCAYDLAILCEYAMLNMKFRSIVSCRVYQAEIQYVMGEGAIPLQQKKSVKEFSKF